MIPIAGVTLKESSAPGKIRRVDPGGLPTMILTYVRLIPALAIA